MPSATDYLDNNWNDHHSEILLKLRGGCRCSWPNAAPPCGACSDHMTEAEAEEVMEIYSWRRESLETRDALLDAERKIRQERLLSMDLTKHPGCLL